MEVRAGLRKLWLLGLAAALCMGGRGFAGPIDMRAVDGAARERIQSGPLNFNPWIGQTPARILIPTGFSQMSLITPVLSALPQLSVHAMAGTESQPRAGIIKTGEQAKTGRVILPALEAAVRGDQSADSATRLETLYSGSQKRDGLQISAESVATPSQENPLQPEAGAHNRRYCVLLAHGVQKLTFKSVLRLAQDSGSRIWSARLGTGLLGLTTCPAGNRGPRDMREVVLAVGEAGLLKLLELGMIPCPSCKPDSIPGFWDMVKSTVQRLYGIGALQDFTSKTLLPFDARRVDWETIVPLTGGLPSRLYVPKGLQATQLQELKERLLRLARDLPAVGYYDRSSPGNFHAYELK